MLTWETGAASPVREFVVVHRGSTIPGVAWLPRSAARGLVLFGHGLTMDRLSAFHAPSAARLAEVYSIAAAAIDAPFHGRRRDPSDRSPRALAARYGEFWRRGGAGQITSEMAAVVEALLDTPEVGPVPVGYWGLSLATQYGLAWLASSSTVRGAVLGLFGLTGPLVRAWAPEVACPVFFVRQLDDEVHPAESSLALYRLLGSARKEIHSSPGSHEAVPASVREASLRFLAEALRPAA